MVAIDEKSLDIANPGKWPFILTPKQVMLITGMGKNKTLDLLQSGELPAKRVRGRWLIPKESFLKWLNETTK